MTARSLIIVFLSQSSTDSKTVFISFHFCLPGISLGSIFIYLDRFICKLPLSNNIFCAHELVLCPSCYPFACYVGYIPLDSIDMYTMVIYAIIYQIDVSL